ncbi:protein of unassigned function [Methylobacterium oryzae CBMB20]|uniref:Protein of unassigned function n=1 Tax=Methylobacterium oryzae CBMB20 TaxID=693986 RepID=A0A089P498_9HYPH|nr:protein of unassigned function [Methylobacterium oryzae CBMB20]
MITNAIARPDARSIGAWASVGALRTRARSPTGCRLASVIAAQSSRSKRQVFTSAVAAPEPRAGRHRR